LLSWGYFARYLHPILELLLPPGRWVFKGSTLSDRKFPTRYGLLDDCSEKETRMKKLVLVAVFLVLCGLFATAAWANPSSQVTLSLSTGGDAYFADSGGTISSWLSGTCGLLSNCISGTALLEPQGILGQYQMWMVGGTATLSGGPLNYTVQHGIIHTIPGGPT
jgi:hypothetical protein